MSNSVNIIKEVFPYLRVKGANKAIEFYKNVFGATEKFRLTEPNGRIGHAELKLGNIVLMLSDEYPEFGIFAPQSVGSTSIIIHLHVDNVDELATRAIEAGVTMLREASDQFYGERSCSIRDPFGHEWMLGHEIEKISAEEMQRRFTKMFN